MNHVKLTTDENTAWCGEPLGTAFYFRDAEAAALNGAHDMGNAVCGRCLDNIIRSLDHNGRASQ